MVKMVKSVAQCASSGLVRPVSVHFVTSPVKEKSSIQWFVMSRQLKLVAHGTTLKGQEMMKMDFHYTLACIEIYSEYYRNNKS